MKIYKDIKDVILYNWIKLTESLQTDKPEFRYLVVGSEIKLPKFVRKSRLQKAYNDLLLQMPELDLSLNKLYTLFLLEYQKIQILQERNKHLEILNKPTKPIEYLNFNQAFSNYINFLDDNYKDFEFQVYGLKENWQELWKNKYSKPIPIKLLENKNMQFFIFEQYFDLLADFDFVDIPKLISKEFIYEFIEVKTLKFPKLRPIEKLLNDLFIELKQPAKWRIIKVDFFNLANLKFKSENENTILDEVIQLRDLTNQEINLKTTTLEEFYQIRKFAHKKIESQKPKK